MEKLQHLDFTYLLVGILFIVAGLIYNAKFYKKQTKEKEYSDVLRTSPITVVTLFIGFYLIFKATQ
jgi:hypothetical protein